jgi:maltose alpha-D-glucosyltransferase/alpha-amylase
MKRMIALRRQHPVFGRGSLEFIRTENRKVITYVRKYEDETILCVANLSRAVQPVEIPLAPFTGLTPVELLGQTQLPRIGDQPYFLTLAPYGFYWFKLQDVVVPTTSRTVPVIDEHPAVPSLFAGVVWDAMLDGSMRSIVEKQALMPFLERQRWFGGKARPITSARFVDWATLRSGVHPAFLTLAEVQYRDGGRERYVLPLAMAGGADADTILQQHGTAVLARITGARKGLLFDGLFDDGVCTRLLEVLERGYEIRMRHGRVDSRVEPQAGEPAAADTALPSGALAKEGARRTISRTAPDQSNTSVLFGRELIMKMFRRVEAGVNPDIEVGAFLTSRGFSRVPALLGSMTYQPADGEAASVVMLQPFVPNQGNAWDVTVEELVRYFDRAKALPEITPGTEADTIGPYLSKADVLGRRTGELHVALASATADEPDFTIESCTAEDLADMARRMREHASEQLRLLEAALPQLDDKRRQLAQRLLSQRDEFTDDFAALTRVGACGARIRCHGDYHLGQVLIAEADVVILDFEGEPARPLDERRRKCSPLRDVAGMVRSFSYAALTGLNVATHTRPEDAERLAPWAQIWEREVVATFLRAYRAATEGTALLPRDADDFDTLLRAFVVDKGLYELAYELNNRPDWAHIPLIGLLNLRSLHHA